MMNLELPRDYRDRLETILKAMLPLEGPGAPRSGESAKVIHDAVWGSRLFYPWEMTLLDSPLLQRLRGIHQIGTAFMTYPSAVHTRFTHTLGVTILADRLLRRLTENAAAFRQDISISQRDVYTVRLAGLLHDIGHCFFSHASEKIINPIIYQLKKSLGLGRVKPHEFFAFIIIHHPAFERFWDARILPLFPNKSLAPDPKEAALMIIGRPPDKERRHLQDIISGPYDVDKLEYLYRDAHMAGLDISYDIERYFYKIRIFRQPDGTNRLAMDQGGVRAVEQLIFSKMMLYSFIYHHQKVLATDSLVCDLILELIDHPQAGPIRISHPLDFLLYNDHDLLSAAMPPVSERFDRIKRRLQGRRLPKRCFVINREFVEDIQADRAVKDSYEKLKRLGRDMPVSTRPMRQSIVDLINAAGRVRADLDDLHVVIPGLPPLDEPTRAPVITVDNRLAAMGEFFDLESWQKTYDLKKFRGYFFSSEAIRREASRAVRDYLSDEFGLTFKRQALVEAKIG